jgi:hypothetical protein
LGKTAPLEENKGVTRSNDRLLRFSIQVIDQSLEAGLANARTAEVRSNDILDSLARGAIFVKRIGLEYVGEEVERVSG